MTEGSNFKMYIITSMKEITTTVEEHLTNLELKLIPFSIIKFRRLWVAFKLFHNNLIRYSFEIIWEISFYI